MTAETGVDLRVAEGRIGLAVTADPGRIGFALLSTEPRDESLSISIQFLDKTFLGPDGRRTRERHLFPADHRPEPGLFSLGPAVTAHLLEAEIVTLADQHGILLGTVSWDGIRPPSSARVDALPLRNQLAETATDTVLERSRAADPTPPGMVSAEPSQGREVHRNRWGTILALVLGALVAFCIGTAALILAGRIGWTLDGAVLTFSGPLDGPFRPEGARARLRPLWYAKPLALFVRDPFATAVAPSWLVLHQDVEADGIVLDLAVTKPDRDGVHVFRVPVAFPIGGTSGGLAVAITVQVAPSPSQAPPPPEEPARPDPVDDAACDRTAGSRFDPDHPADHAFADEVFAVPIDILEQGILQCDARQDRSGADRRLLVQRGRLLAARALLRAADGDVGAARADMAAALAAWHTGSAAGSAFADSLLGAYAAGTFNRPTIRFAEPDDGVATAAWQRGMTRGSVVAERNYAAQLLGGRGVAPDPARAFTLLRDAIAHGDERAAGVLGVALYTGAPAGVPLDKAEGWTLIVRAQCVDKSSADILDAEIARGARPAGVRRACS